MNDNNVWNSYFITPHPVLSVGKVGAAAGALAGGGAVLAADPSGALHGLKGEITMHKMSVFPNHRFSINK